MTIVISTLCIVVQHEAQAMHAGPDSDKSQQSFHCKSSPKKDCVAGSPHLLDTIFGPDKAARQ